MRGRATSFSKGSTRSRSRDWKTRPTDNLAMRKFTGIKRAGMVCCGALTIAMWSGCTTTSTHESVSAQPVDAQTALAQAPSKDKVLLEYRSGLSALRQGNYAEAQRMLDDALLTIGGIIGTEDKSAKKSRHYFSEESKKTFIGEPYERCMAYFYRGIVYWMNGEPDNARACFRNAEIQDSDTENRDYANDWILMDYLDGLVSMRLSSDGSDALARAQKYFKLG